MASIREYIGKERKKNPLKLKIKICANKKSGLVERHTDINSTYIKMWLKLLQDAWDTVYFITVAVALGFALRNERRYTEPRPYPTRSY